MQVEIKRMNKFKQGNLLAFVDAVVNGINLKGIKVISGANGLFVGMPSEKNEKDGKYYDLFYIVDAEEKKEFDKKVIEYYNNN